MQQNPISSIMPYIWTNVNFVRDYKRMGLYTGSLHSVMFSRYNYRAISQKVMQVIQSNSSPYGN